MKTLTVTDRSRIVEVVSACKVCYVAMVDSEGLPYVVPMNYVWHEGIFYFHSGPEGTKSKIWQERPDVCIALHQGEKLVCQHPDMACSYSMLSTSVICRGRVEEVIGFDEKRECLDIFMKRYTNRQFQYGEPSVNHVRIWKLIPKQITCKSFGNSMKK